MRIFSLKQNKTSLHYPLILVLLTLLCFITPLPNFAEDTRSIDTLRQMGKDFAQIAEKASPAVVGITATQVVAQDYPTMREWPFGQPFNPSEDDFFDFFFRRPAPRRRSPQRKFHQSQLVQGSGFIVSSDGYILTNNHLVGEAEDVKVKLRDGQDFKAKIIGTDPDTDVAVIKIDANDLHYLALADSDKLEVGEWVIAIGNPFGLSHTVTQGIVSAKGRSGLRFPGHIPEYQDYIQTDAAINRGNSGGPLLNLDGKVIGINTAIYASSGGNVGIGFAIPVNMAKAVYVQLVKSGTVIRGWLGVSIQDLTPKLADSFGLEDTKGTLLAEVFEDSAAEKAGLKQGDIVVELDGQPIEKTKELQKRVAMLKPDTKVKIVVLRDGRRKTLTVKLGKRPSNGQIARARPKTVEQLGVHVQNLTDDLAERLGYEGLSGVVVTQVEPGSEAAQKGITAGTLIVEVNRKPVKNTKDFNEAIEQAANQGFVLLLIKDQRYTRFVVLTLPEK